MPFVDVAFLPIVTVPNATNEEGVNKKEYLEGRIYTMNNDSGFGLRTSTTKSFIIQAARNPRRGDYCAKKNLRISLALDPTSKAIRPSSKEMVSVNFSPNEESENK